MNAYSHLTSNSGAYEIKGDSIVFDISLTASIASISYQQQGNIFRNKIKC
jgi:hypothetical protein